MCTNAHIAPASLAVFESGGVAHLSLIDGADRHANSAAKYRNAHPKGHIMFRTITLAAATVFVAGSAFATPALEAALKSAIADDNRALAAGIQAKIDNGAFGGADSSVGLAHAIENNDQALVKAIQSKVDGVAFTTRGGSNAALEAALQHAIQSDDRALVRAIEAKLGR